MTEPTHADPLRPDQDMAAAAILIVDDEPANVRLLEQMLALDGYRNVVGITDARETLSRVAEQNTDLLLLDLNELFLGHLDDFLDIRVRYAEPEELGASA